MSNLYSLNYLSNLDALNNWTDGVAEGASGARVLIDFRKMGLLVKRDCLVTGVIAGHVTFSYETWKSL